MKMKLNISDINYKEVKRRIEMEMADYSPGEWANKVGVKPNIISNIHAAKAKQRPSINYIIAVALATRKPIEYFLWGKTFDGKVQEPDPGLGASLGPYAKELDPEMGKRMQFWREDMGISLAELSRRTDLPIDFLKRIENGHHTTTDVIVKIASALRCSTDFILGCGSSLVDNPRRIEGVRGRSKRKRLTDEPKGA